MQNIISQEAHAWKTARAVMQYGIEYRTVYNNGLWMGSGDEENWSPIVMRSLNSFYSSSEAALWGYPMVYRIRFYEPFLVKVSL